VSSRVNVTRALGVAALATVLVVLAAGCGGGGNKSSSGGDNGGGSTGKTYPLLRIVLDSPDYLDPQLYYTVEAYQWMNYVWTGLVGYTHKAGPAGAQLQPYLAESMPTISSDGKDYKFTLRKNLKYSNGKALKASDFKYSIERAFKMDSPGVGFFGEISGVSGANGFATTKKGHISGIITNDAKRTIEIKLDAPRGDFLYILALEFAHVVPTGTPASDQSTHPIPATGPYMLKSYTPNRSFELVRNPNFNGQIPTIPTGAPDRLVAKIVADPVASYQQVVSGKADFDFNQVPNDRLPEATGKYKDQLRIFTNANTYYFAINNKLPPFNNIDARRAVQYAIDRQAIVSGIYGGLARPTQNFLPPGYPQYKKINAYTFDLAKAKQLVQKSGTAGQTVDVYGPNAGLSKETTEYLAGQLNKIGYKSKLHLLGDQVYFQTIGNQATKAQAMFTDWYQDYPHPLDWFDVLLNGDRITKTHNNNPGNVDVPSVNKEIDALKKVPELTPEVNARWAKVDSDLIDKYSTTVPYLNLSGTNFFSKDIDMSCYSFHVVVYWDWGISCKK
jgi:peptide/nickel transport system substrate-binding protein